MRIGLFTDFYLPHPGGVEMAVYNHYLALKAKGHEVFIICPDSQEQRQEEIDVTRLETLKGIVVNEHRQARISEANLKLLETLQLDLVHSHSQGTVSLLGAWYAQYHGVKYIQTYHYNSVEWYRTKSPVRRYINSAWLLWWFGRQKKVLGLVKSVHLNSRGLLYNKWLWQGTLITAPYAKSLVVPSAHFLAALKNVYSSGDYQLVPNAVDVTKYEPSLVRKPGRIRVLWVGRMAGEKRPMEFIQAVQILNQHDHEFTADMIGGGPLLSLAQKHKPSNVNLHGAMSYRETKEFYKNADVFVVSSYLIDNQPMVIAEASAAGLPMVLSDKRLISQVCPKACVVADGPTPEALAKAMASAMHKRTSKSSAPIIKFAYENYDLSVLADRLERMYAT